MIGYQYSNAMTAPEGNSARFVSAQGDVARAAQGTPSFMETTQVFLAGLFGRAPEKKTGLSALHTRTRLAQLGSEELANREMKFWMNFTSKMGFTGP